MKISETSVMSDAGRIESLPTLQLLGSDDPVEQALLHWRISLVVLVPVVALLAIPLAQVNPRQGRFLKLFPAILLYVSYIGLLIVGRKAMENGQVPNWLGLWWVHLIYFAIGWTLLFGGDWLRKVRAQRAQA